MRLTVSVTANPGIAAPVFSAAAIARAIEAREGPQGILAKQEEIAERDDQPHRAELAHPTTASEPPRRGSCRAAGQRFRDRAILLALR